MVTMKKALITGVTGQDGTYLAQQKIGKDCEAHDIKCRASRCSTPTASTSNYVAMPKGMFIYCALSLGFLCLPF